MISMVGRPVEFITVVLFVDGVLRLISRGIDECKRLAHARFLPDPHSRDRPPGLHPELEGTDSSGLGWPKYSS